MKAWKRGWSSFDIPGATREKKKSRLESAPLPARGSGSSTSAAKSRGAAAARDRRFAERGQTIDQAIDREMAEPAHLRGRWVERRAGRDCLPRRRQRVGCCGVGVSGRARLPAAVVQATLGRCRPPTEPGRPAWPRPAAVEAAVMVGMASAVEAAAVQPPPP